MPVDIQIDNTQQLVDILDESVKTVVALTLQSEGVSCDEVAIHFVDEKTLCDLHEQFFDDPSPTDCITLPIDPPNTKPYCLLGEVFVSPQAAIDYTKSKQLDLYEEITLYVVHGILHLLGYDDVQEEDRIAMRAAEQRVMTVLRQANTLITPPFSY
jgi:probable rRNA maturation factor